MLPWLIGGAIAAAAALLYWWLTRQNQSGGGGSSGSNGSGGSGQGNSRYDQDDERMAELRRQAEERARQEQERRERKVREVLESDPLLAKHLCHRAGETAPLRDMSRDRALVARIARTVPEMDIEVLRIAATQRDINLDVKIQTNLEPVKYPTNRMEVEQLRDISELHEVLPEQMALDDDQFYQQLATDGLFRLQPYEERVQQKLLFVLVDVSGSMDENMPNGMPRHVWARGVTISLLLRAARGEAKYFLREFDGKPHSLKTALTPDEADRLIRHVYNTGFSGSHTYIFGAVSQAVEDIKTKGGEISRAEIVLITDAQDPSMNDVETVRQLLGDNTRLHVAVIGCQSPPLRQVAASYREIG